MKKKVKVYTLRISTPACVDADEYEVFSWFCLEPMDDVVAYLALTRLFISISREQTAEEVRRQDRQLVVALAERLGYELIFDAEVYSPLDESMREAMDFWRNKNNLLAA